MFRFRSLTIPDDDAPPAKFGQLSLSVLGVPLHVPVDLRIPVRDVALRLRLARAPLAIMPVPKAAVDEDHSLPFPEDDIRLTRQILRVETEP